MNHRDLSRREGVRGIPMDLKFPRFSGHRIVAEQFGEPDKGVLAPHEALDIIPWRHDLSPRLMSLSTCEWHGALDR